MLTFLIVLIGLSVLILGHEAGHFFVAKLFKLRVDEFGFGFPPRLFAFKRGETEYSINWLPFGGFVKIAGENDHMDKESETIKDSALDSKEMKRYFFARPAWQRAIVMGAGVAINFLIGWMLIAMVFMIGTKPILGVQEVVEDSPAAAAGIQAGDIIRDYFTVEEFSAFVGEHESDQAIFTVVRGSEEVQVSAEPQIYDGQARVGVVLAQAGSDSQNFFEAIWSSLLAALRVCWLTLTAFYLLAKNLLLHASLLEGVVGPVGIFSVAQQTSQFGLVYLLQLLGFISLNLAVANLIPFPALDGGRLFFLAIEKIKGSPISQKVEMWANGAGFLLLIGIMVLVTIRDVSSWF